MKESTLKTNAMILSHTNALWEMHYNIECYDKWFIRTRALHSALSSYTVAIWYRYRPFLRRILTRFMNQDIYTYQRIHGWQWMNQMYPYYSVHWHLAPVTPSVQHEHSTLAPQSICIDISDLKHNEAGTVPRKFVLLYKCNLLSRVKYPKVDGIVPLNWLLHKFKEASWTKIPNLDGMTPFNLL